MSFADGKLRVLIATTNGPVEVLLLTEEDAAIGRCVACIGGTTETADIASAYHAFVVRPTGVIEGRFGHSCYRLDVSARIDAGSSWQLGVFAAHALLAAGRLAQENEVADGILWATGSVRPVDLTVGAVSHVPEKLVNSGERLSSELDAKRPVLLALPAANESDVTPEATAELRGRGAEVLAVPHAQALFDKIGIKLQGAPSKAQPPPLPASAIPVAPMPKPRRRLFPWLIAAALIGTVGASAALVLPRLLYIRSFSLQGGETTAPDGSIASPTPASVPPSQRAALVPESIPFITATDKQLIRDEYVSAPNYKALAITMYESFFATGLPSQDAADKAALEKCESGKRRPPVETSLTAIEHHCDIFASGMAVTLRRDVPMPPKPWTDNSIQRPFVAAELPLVPQTLKESVDRRYPRAYRSKAMVMSENRRFFWTFSETSTEEATRRSLERCGYLSKAACFIIAVDDAFVSQIPTLARAVGFYHPESLAMLGMQADERAEVVRRLATSNQGWQAVALGTTRHAGVRVGATSERGAVDGALQNCAVRDRDCRVAVIGPFLVDPSPAQTQIAR